MEKAGWLERQATNEGWSPPLTWLASYLRLDDTAALLLRGERHDDCEHHDLVLGVHDGETFTRTERFPLEELDAAIACFDELLDPADQAEARIQDADEDFHNRLEVVPFGHALGPLRHGLDG